MLCRAAVLGICLVIVFLGCKKKEQEPQKAAKPEPRVVVPDGFAQVPGTKPPLFISKKPATVGEYRSYLKATGVQAPQSLGEPAAPPDDSPVAGLSLAEAERFAKWSMARLPTASEWTAAAQIVGTKPYPWGKELGATAVRPDAQLFLVREWGAQGSLQEQAAREAKAALLQELLIERTRVVVDLSKELETTAAEGPARVAERWKAVKPAVFGAIQKAKELARLSAERERRKDVLAILNKVAQEKLKVVNLRIAEDTPPEKLKEAAAAYSQFLAEQRKKVQEVQDGLVKQNQAASEKANELTKKLEGAGEALAARLEAIAAAAQVATAPEKMTLEDAVQQQQRLHAALTNVKAAADKLGAFLDGLEKAVRARTLELDKGLASLAEQDANIARIEDIQARIKALNENLEEEFVQEPHLFGDLSKLTEVSARTKALDYEVGELKATLDKFERIELEGEKGAEPGPPAGTGTAG